MRELALGGNVVALGTLGPVVTRSGVKDGGGVPGAWRGRVRIRDARVTEPDRFASGGGTEVGKAAFQTVSSDKGGLAWRAYNVLVGNGNTVW